MTPVESQHAIGGLKTLAELQKFDELLPKYSKSKQGKTVDFMSFLRDWNSSHATPEERVKVRGVYLARGLCAIVQKDNHVGLQSIFRKP